MMMTTMKLERVPSLSEPGMAFKDSGNISKLHQHIKSLPTNHPVFLELQEHKSKKYSIISYLKLVYLQHQQEMDDFATTQAEVDLFEDDFTPNPSADTSTNITPSQPPISAPTRPAKDGHSSWHRNNKGYENGQTGNIYRPSDRQIATENAAAAMEPPTEPTTDVKPRNKVTEPREPAAVRGDRSGTGGIKKPKMTEEELTERMEKMKLISEQRAKQHDKQEADKAAQSKIEKLNQQKYAEELKATREQDMERAKNQQRKLRAQGGREWDSEKQDSDIVDRGRGNSSMYSRGAHGGVSAGRGLGNSRYADDHESAEDQGGYFQSRDNRGRGGNGYERRGGRGPRGGRGRGGRGGVASTSSSVPPTDSTEAFPSLPAATPSTSKSAKAPSTTETAKKVLPIEEPSGPIGAWAEEMATPVE